MKANRRVLYAALLVLASGMVACDRTDELGTAPVLQEVQQPSVVYSKVDKKTVKLLGSSAGGISYYRSEGVGWQGGALQFGRFRLEVRKHTLRSNTVFEATVTEGAEIKVDLKAWDVRSGNAVSTFAKPLDLTIDLSDLEIEDWREVVVVYLNPNGTYEKVPVTIDEDDKEITARLGHFSEYAPGTNRTEPTPPTTTEP